MKHKGYEVWIEVNGDRLYEWETVPKANTISCWVSSEPGAVFEVHLKHPAKRSYPCGELFVDGKHVDGKIGERNVRGHLVICGTTVGGTAEVKLKRKLKFAELIVTEDEGALRDPAFIKHVGLIELQVVTGTLSADPHPECEEQDELDVPIVHEEIKEAGLHCVTFGEEFEDSDPNGRLQFRKGSTVLQFVFCYRPAEFLRAEGIIPRARVPSSELGGYHPYRVAAKLPGHARTVGHVHVPSPELGESDTDRTPARSLSSRRMTRHDSLSSPELSDDHVYKTAVVKQEVESGALSDSDVDVLSVEEEKELERLMLKKRRAADALHHGRAKQPKIEAVDIPWPFQPGEVIDLTADDMGPPA